MTRRRGLTKYTVVVLTNEDLYSPYRIAQNEESERNKTSSSAVAERPRDALCLSVVSFNSVIRRAQCFIAVTQGFRFTTAYN